MLKAVAAWLAILPLGAQSALTTMLYQYKHIMFALINKYLTFVWGNIYNDVNLRGVVRGLAEA
ncbi:hypothetical protein KUL17_11650 [Alteromonas sp. KUL17]|nr:hypothetical protein KUL17_11650 [Alteromonas sp. KUL17]